MFLRLKTRAPQSVVSSGRACLDHLPAQYGTHALRYLFLCLCIICISSCGPGSSPNMQTTPTSQPIVITALPTTAYTATPTQAPAPPIPLQLSSDPYTGNNAGQSQTEVEPGVFAYGSTLVAAFQAGRFTDIGAANIGWATSIDGGLTWKNGFLSGTTKLAGGPYDRITDPVVTYDAAHHTWIIASVSRLVVNGNLTAPSILVNRSTDGGLTWSKPVTVADAGNNGILDKDWIVCDNTSSSPYYGRCYIQWDDFLKNDLVLMSTSTDGGKTWSSAKTTANSASGIGGEPLVQPGGKVIVPISSGNENSILVYTSSNGGNSWSNTTTITGVTSYAPNAYYHDNILLTSGIDGTGKVYLTWVDCRFELHCNGNDLAMTTSTDGVNWTAIQRIPIAPVASGTNYYVPGLGVDPTTSGSTAHLGLTYYYYSAHCFSACPLYVGFVSSINGGSSWTTKIQLAGPMLPSWIASGNNKVGDYIATAFLGGKAFPVFPIGYAPANGHLNEAMYTLMGGLSV